VRQSRTFLQNHSHNNGLKNVHEVGVTDIQSWKQSNQCT
jgi:hypothetical protein